MDIDCVICFLVAIASLAWMTRLILGSRVQDRRLLESWRDVFAAWNEASSVAKRSLIFFILSVQLLRGGRWGALIACYGAIGVLLAAVCGPEWPQVLQTVRAILKDFYDLIRDLRGVPPANPVMPGK